MSTHDNPGRDTMLETLCAALRGERTTSPQPEETEALLGLVTRHGVGPLLYAAIAASTELQAWPESLVERLRRSAREHAALEMVRREELTAALQALAAAQVPSLLLKGTPLAYTHYPSPELRTRDDTDLLIDHDRLDTTLVALRGLGYERAPGIDGDLVMQQLQLRRTDRYGAPHVIDLHWRVSNPQLFAATLDFDELAANARPIPELGTAAQGLGDAHALLLACMHRVAHHGASDRLIWIYDIHLLLQAMDATARDAFVELCVRKGMARVCADGIALSAERLHTPGADLLAQTLGTRAAASGDEASARYLRSDRTEAALLWDDLRALPGWRARLRLMREHLFPSPAYMRERYGTGPNHLLPWLYVKRAAGGVRRLFQRRRAA